MDIGGVRMIRVGNGGRGAQIAEVHRSQLCRCFAIRGARYGAMVEGGGVPRLGTHWRPFTRSSW